MPETETEGFRVISNDGDNRNVMSRKYESYQNARIYYLSKTDNCLEGGFVMLVQGDRTILGQRLAQRSGVENLDPPAYLPGERMLVVLGAFVRGKAIDTRIRRYEVVCTREQHERGSNRAAVIDAIRKDLPDGVHAYPSVFELTESCTEPQLRDYVLSLPVARRIDLIACPPKERQPCPKTLSPKNS